MRTPVTFWAAYLGACAAFSPALADQDLLREFAVCTGRLSAEMEHAWLVQNGRADQAQTHRDAMASLLLAVTGDGEAPRAMRYRIDAKAAHRALLMRASFAADPQQAAAARALASTHSSACSAMLLS